MLSSLSACTDDVVMYTEHSELTYDAANIGDGDWRVAAGHAAKYR